MKHLRLVVAATLIVITVPACEDDPTGPSSDTWNWSGVVDPGARLEIKGIIGLCDFFIGSRMHACIAALSQGIPTVGVAYSKKFGGVFESVGVADWFIDAREADQDEATEKVMRLFGEREAVRTTLADSVGAAQAALRDAFEALFVKQAAVGAT